MTTTLVLVAASGLAREVLAVLDGHGSVRVTGVLDDDPALAGSLLAGVPVLGPLGRIVEHPQASVLVCAGRGAAREAIVGRLTALGVTRERYTTVVHPSVDLPASCTVGVGTILLAGTVLTADVRVGDHVVAMPHVTLTHDDVLEDFVTLTSGVSLAGGVLVQERAYLGMNASVREHLTVGKDAVVGMGAAVLRDVPAGERWAGVPAGPIGAGSPRAAGRHENDSAPHTGAGPDDGMVR